MSNLQDLTPESVLADIGYPGFVKALFNRTGDMSKDFAHAILGIATELNELRHAQDLVNRNEELGDKAFYVQALYNIAYEAGVKVDEQELLGLQLEAADSMAEMLDQVAPWSIINDATTDLMDMAKRWVGYGKEPNLLEACVIAGALALFVGYLLKLEADDYQVIAVQNVAKLIERYKGLAFNADRAINRDTVAERSVLEHHGV